MFLASLALLLASQTYPDELDLFRSAAVRPQINLLLDQSASMNSGARPTRCHWWASTYNGGDRNLNKNQQMRAALVGCTSPDDGVLHTWYPHVTFGLREFPARPPCGNPPPPGCASAPEWCPCNLEAGPASASHPWGLQLAGFGASEASLTAAAQSVGASGSTPITEALALGARDFDAYFRDSNTRSCRPSFNVLLSDGNPNGSPVNYQHACSGSGVLVPPGAPWLGAQYNATQSDLLCRVQGNQTIRTHTIGFGTLDTFNPTNLQRIAREGQGEYHYAADVDDLSSVFRTLMTGVVSTSAVFFAGPAIDRRGLYDGNHAYVASYAPLASGPWRGNVKKHCLLPRARSDGRYDPEDRSCLFQSPDGSRLYSNPQAADAWTGTTTTTADIGGAGLVMRRSLGEAGGTPASPRPRVILTWRPDEAAYVRVDPSSWSADDGWLLEGERASFIHQLHGYTFDADERGEPRQVGAWPIGDVIHTPVLLLRYDAGPNACESRPGACFVAFGANDGMLHFLDAYDGRETSALVPAELWRPNGVATHLLRDIDRQPSPERSHHYYLDGGLRLFHADADGDGAIDPDEPAALVLGLGRGGRAYYQIPVSRFDGTPSAARNPVYPLLPNPEDGLAQLQETWAAPWIGRASFDGAPAYVAAFGSGHVSRLDDAERMVPGLVPSPDEIEPLSSPQSATCRSVASHSGLAGDACELIDPAGYADPFPQDLTRGPLAEPDAIAYRLHFATLDLDPTAKLWIQDGRGAPAAVLTGGGVAAASWSPRLDPAGWTPWIYSSELALRLVTQGNGNPGHRRGYSVDRIAYVRRRPVPDHMHYPTVYVVDLQRWNGATPRAFTSAPAAGGVRLRLTRHCASAGDAGGLCIDARSSPDLHHLRCPISAEISTVTTGDVLSALYFGDECGQLWAARAEPSGWRVRRLLELNPRINLASAQARSGDLRKIFRRVDTVLSTCPGKRVTAVYFGTGDVQRPMATDALAGRHNSGRDVVGVVWDDGQVANLTDADLTDVTSSGRADPRAPGSKGWIIQLQPQERMLRDPFVLEGVAYFKTFRPSTQAAECSPGGGVDTIYAADNCTGEAPDQRSAANPSPSARQVWSGATSIGGNILVLAPSGAAPIVAPLDTTRSTNVVLNSRKQRGLRIYNWRLPKDS